MKLYLDACCLNRLTDDQSQARIAEEAEAVERILRLLRDGVIEWLSSTVLKIETSNAISLFRQTQFRWMTK